MMVGTVDGVDVESNHDIWFDISNIEFSFILGTNEATLGTGYFGKQAELEYNGSYWEELFSCCFVVY